MSQAHENNEVHRLQVSRETGPQEDMVTYTIIRPDQARDTIIRHRLPRKLLDACQEALRETATRLVAFTKAGAAARRLAPDEFTFEQLGNALTNCLPSDLIDQVLAASRAPLAITTDDPAFPWHLVRVHGTFLGIYRPVSVRLALPLDEVHAGTPDGDSVHAVLLIVDPSGDHPQAHDEAREITSLLQKRDPHLREVSLRGPDASNKNVQLHLTQNYHYIHYAGHILFEREHGGLRQLVLAQNEHFSLHQIRHYPHTGSFVFMNGCWGGMSQITFRSDTPGRGSRLGSLDGFGVEFLRSGARAFIAPLWPVYDNYAGTFARQFYELAVTGIPLGEVLRRMREEAYRAEPWNPTWACYLLFGSPMETLFARQPQDSAAASRPPAATAAMPAAPAIAAAAAAPAREGTAPQDAGAPRSPAPPSEQEDDWIRDGHDLEKRLIDIPNQRFARDAALALGLAQATVRKEGRKGMHGIDLAVALCRSSADPELHELLAQYFAAEKIGDYAEKLLTDAEKKRPPKHSGMTDNVHNAVAQAGRRVRMEGREAITALDLAWALLAEPRKTVNMMYDEFHINRAEVRAALDGLISTRRHRTVVSTGGMEFHSMDGIRMQPMLRSYGADLLQLARRNELRYVWGWSERAQRKPFIPSAAWTQRDRTLTRLTEALTREDGGHALVYGAPGVGKWALLEALAYALANGAGDVRLAGLARWGVWGLPKADPSASPRELAKRIETFLAEADSAGPVIAAVEDLSRYLLGDADDAERLRKQLVYYLASPRIRLVVTTSDREQLWRLLAPVSLAAAIEVPAVRAGEAHALVGGHIEWLANTHRVEISAEAVNAACAQADLRALAQPGLGLRLLRVACGIARGDVPASAPAHDDADEMTRLDPATHETVNDHAAVERVTAEHIRQAKGELRADLGGTRQG